MEVDESKIYFVFTSMFLHELMAKELTKERKIVPRTNEKPKQA